MRLQCLREVVYCVIFSRQKKRDEGSIEKKYEKSVGKTDL